MDNPNLTELEEHLQVLRNHKLDPLWALVCQELNRQLGDSLSSLLQTVPINQAAASRLVGKIEMIKTLIELPATLEAEINNKLKQLKRGGKA